MASSGAALEVLAKDEPGRVAALGTRARALAGLQRWSEAQAEFDDALAAAQSTAVTPNVAGMLRFYRARAQWTSGKDTRHALAEARAAREAVAPFVRGRAIRKMDSWLEQRPRILGPQPSL
jgi:hypothetical protein